MRTLTLIILTILALLITACAKTQLMPILLYMVIGLKKATPKKTFIRIVDSALVMHVQRVELSFHMIFCYLIAVCRVKVGTG